MTVHKETLKLRKLNIRRNDDYCVSTIDTSSHFHDIFINLCRNILSFLHIHVKEHQRSKSRRNVEERRQKVASFQISII